MQQELEQLIPIPDDDLAFASHLLENFAEHWQAAQDDPTEQERLFQLMLARVWVVEDKVVRMCLRPNFHVTVGLDAKRPTEFSVDPSPYTCGSDGYHSLSGKLQVAFIPPYSLLESKQLWPAYPTNERDQCDPICVASEIVLDNLNGQLFDQ